MHICHCYGLWHLPACDIIRELHPACQGVAANAKGAKRLHLDLLHEITLHQPACWLFGLMHVPAMSRLWCSPALPCPAVHDPPCKGRLIQCFMYMRSSPNDNHYAHPLDFVAVVDLNQRKVGPIPALDTL